MQPLSEFYYFSKVAEHGGYARAGRALGIPKSRLSRQVSALEARLGVRLVNRSTRRFAITDTGQEVLRHAQAMLAEADAALAAVEFARAEPRGIVRIACPVALAQNALAPLVPEFLRRYPQVRLQLLVSNRRVDVLGEGIDAAIRVRSAPSGEDGLVMRSFGDQSEVLVASPAWLAARGRPAHPRELEALPTLSFAGDAERQHWDLSSRDGEQVRVEVQPRLLCHDFAVLRIAALQGMGVALLPESVVRADLDARRLECVLPDWRLPQGVLHVVFASRRGLLPAVRACIDFLAERLPGALRMA